MRHAAVILLFSTCFFCQESKPRIYVRARGTVNSMTQTSRGLFGGTRSDSITDEHDESIELTKELRLRCDGVIITLNEAAADYVVMLNRESKAKRGIFNKNSQVLVADKNGDVIWTKDVRAVASAAKDVCAAVITRGVRNAAQPAQGTTVPAPVAVTSPQGAPGTAVPASSSNAPQRTTSVSRASLGISGEDWQERQYSGVEVTDVRENGSGQIAGLRIGNIIIQVNGKTIASTQDLAAVLAPMEPGSTINIVYLVRTNLGWISEETAVILAKAD